MAPWYMPTLASLGVVLVVMSLLERRTVWRVFALLAVVLLRAPSWHSCTRCDCRRTRGQSRWDDLSRRSNKASRRHAVHAARLGRRSEQRACLLPRPVVTHLHDRAGSARTAPRRFSEAEHGVLVVSVEGLDDARKTQADFPHLIVLADQGRSLSEMAGLIHPHAAPEAATPTCRRRSVDRHGTVAGYIVRPR